MDENSKKIKKLVTRLKEANKQAEALSSEVEDIRKQISLLSNNEIFKNFTQTNRSKSFDECDTIDLINFSKRLGENEFSSPNKKIKTDFTEIDDYVVVYTDGACENNGKVNAKAGFGVWFGDNHPWNVSKPVVGRPTNNTAEIQACISALTIAKEKGIQKLTLKTDSQFTINCITKWIFKWKKNNWRLVNGGDVKNKSDLIKLDNLTSLFVDIKWEYVAGHKGIRGNEEADKLARLGAQAYKNNF